LQPARSSRLALSGPIFTQLAFTAQQQTKREQTASAGCT
jgi:hypothetical protein